MQTPTLDALKSHPAVVGTREWEGKRTYLRIRGYNPGFRGDKTAAAYWDHQTERLVLMAGKGTRSRGFGASFGALAAAFEHDYIR